MDKEQEGHIVITIEPETFEVAPMWLENVPIISNISKRFSKAREDRITKGIHILEERQLDTLFKLNVKARELEEDEAREQMLIEYEQDRYCSRLLAVLGEPFLLPEDYEKVLTIFLAPSFEEVNETEKNIGIAYSDPFEWLSTLEQYTKRTGTPRFRYFLSREASEVAADLVEMYIERINQSDTVQTDEQFRWNRTGYNNLIIELLPLLTTQRAEELLRYFNINDINSYDATTEPSLETDEDSGVTIFYHQYDYLEPVSGYNPLKSFLHDKDISSPLKRMMSARIHAVITAEEQASQLPRVEHERAYERYRRILGSYARQTPHYSNVAETGLRQTYLDPYFLNDEIAWMMKIKKQGPIIVIEDKNELFAPPYLLKRILMHMVKQGVNSSTRSQFIERHILPCDEDNYYGFSINDENDKKFAIEILSKLKDTSRVSKYLRGEISRYVIGDASGI